MTNYSIGGTPGVGTGTFRPFVRPRHDQYNFGPVNHYLRPDTRYSLGAMGHYELAEFADVYTQLMFTDVRSIAQIAPGGAFFDTLDDQLRQPAAVALQQRTTLGCTPAMIASGDSACRCTSVVATSKAAVASRTSTTPRSAASLGHAARSRKGGSTT